MTAIAAFARDQFSLLTFRGMSGAPRERYRAYLSFGLVLTALVGAGRYWDNPNAFWWQQIGLGSVAYVFVLAGLIWALVKPLRPARWSYGYVLLFLTMTSLPALIYAIPVERFMPLDAAQTVNAVFLLVVAAWRVALYAFFLLRFAQLPVGATIVACSAPLVLIVSVLALYNLEHAVFEVMAGNSPGTGNDGAYVAVLLLTAASWLAAPIVLIGYFILVIRRGRESGP